MNRQTIITTTTATTTTPHVLIIPHPLQGHVNPMLYLAEILCIAKFKVTFVSSTYIHGRLTRYDNLETRFSRYPGFRFEAISDGLPDEHVRAGNDGAKEVCKQFIPNLVAHLRALLVGASATLGTSEFGTYVTSPVTCMILDGWLSVVHDIANEVEISVILFRCFSASCVWVYYCIPDLIEAGEIPFQDDEDSMNQLLKNAPGLSTFLRYRDLPRFCRLNDVASCREIQQSFATEMHVTQRSHALILNTCEELEGPILDLIRSRCTQTYSIGPLHTHLRNRLKLAQPALSLNSGFEVTAYIPGIGHNLQPDQSWLSWLEQKPDKSVLYVSFGSITMLEKEQLTEIWAGLVQSQKYFMWAVRPNLIIGGESDSPDPEELLDGTKDRGLFAGWVPQEEVLAHRAVGGFLTHSGWNSTLESLTAGVPMLCWPYFGDQQVNSRCVSEVWRIGLDMKDTCDRNVVAQMIRDLMDCRNVELQTSVAKLSELAERSVTEGGSSYCNLDSLIHDIQQMAERHNNVNYYPSDSKAET